MTARWITADKAAALACAVWPFLAFGWVLRGHECIGQDYLRHFIPQGLWYRSHAAIGVEPWWSMSTGGMPVGGLALAQIFHLPAWLLSHVPGYWTGDAVRVFAVRHLLLLGFAHGLGYVVLRRVGRVPPVAAWVLSFALLYQLRTLDCFRYGSALDAFVYGYAALSFALLYLKEGSAWSVAAVGAAVHLLFTAGYPPMLLYMAVAAALGLALYRLYLHEPGAPLFPRLAWLLAAAAAGTLLAAPNWLPFVEWLQVNDRRVHQATLGWSDYRPLSWAGMGLNVARPWLADVTSAFGGTTALTLLLTALIVGARARPRRVALALALAMPLLYALGTGTPLFSFFFHFVPGFAQVRAPGRMTVVLAPLMVMGVLVASAALRELAPADRERALRRALRVAGVFNGALLLTSLAALLAGIDHASREAEPLYSPRQLTGAWSPARQLVWTAAGLVASALACLVRAPWLAACLVPLTLLQAAMTLRHGTWVVPTPRTHTIGDLRAANHLPLYERPALFGGGRPPDEAPGTATVPFAEFRRLAGPNADCFLPVYRRRPKTARVLLPFYLSEHTVCLEGQRLEAVLGQECQDGVVRTLVESGPCGTPPSDNTGLASLNRDSRLTALSPNLFALSVRTDRESVLVTPYPFVPGWTAALDGQPVPTLRVNAAFVGVRVPPGPHEVRVAYESRMAVAAYRVFTATVWGLLLFLIARARRAPVWSRWLMAALVSAAALIGEREWQRELQLGGGRAVLLENDYDRLLTEQLRRWDPRH
jgi:hypothetical protein